MHLYSNVWKHGQNVGLQVRYVKKPEFSFQLRTFLPLQDVVRGFVAVCIEIRTNFGNAADELLVYFDDDDNVTLFILGRYKYKMIQVEVKNNILKFKLASF